MAGTKSAPGPRAEQNRAGERCRGPQRRVRQEEGTTLTVLQYTQGWESTLSLLGKIALEQWSVLPLSFEMPSQGRAMARKFEHFQV